MTTHIEEFARRLRELKERSGRSYGMLATRLHVSTSTLHRYCNGAAVPGEYAPVERFARQCGAAAEELVALHQLWLLADAARRHEPPPAATAPPPPTAPTAPSTPTAPTAPSAHPTPAGPPPGSALPDVTDVPGPRGERRSGRRRRVLVVLAVAAALAAVVVPLALRAVHGPGAAPGRERGLRRGPSPGRRRRSR